jgi:hypothetical protein
MFKLRVGTSTFNAFAAESHDGAAGPLTYFTSGEMHWYCNERHQNHVILSTFFYQLGLISILGVIVVGSNKSASKRSGDSIL